MHPHRNYPRQPVGWGTFVEAPPPVVAPYVEPRPADWLLLAVLRPAWAYRLELSLVALLAVAYVWLGNQLGRQDADRMIVAAAFVVALLGRNRQELWIARCMITRRPPEPRQDARPSPPCRTVRRRGPARPDAGR